MGEEDIPRYQGNALEELTTVPENFTVARTPHMQNEWNVEQTEPRFSNCSAFLCRNILIALFFIVFPVCHDDLFLVSINVNHVDQELVGRLPVFCLSATLQSRESALLLHFSQTLGYIELYACRFTCITAELKSDDLFACNICPFFYGKPNYTAVYRMVSCQNN